MEGAGERVGDRVINWKGLTVATFLIKLPNFGYHPDPLGTSTLSVG